MPSVVRVPDLHKSAFWIYGVTAMVMREPLSTVLRHAAAAGWGDAGVHLEALRALIVWMLLSRQFSVLGIYFDRVYLQPDSAQRYPRRSYPIDFLLGIGAVLASVGAAGLVGTPGSLFAIVAGVALSWDVVWLALALAMRHTSVSLLAPGTIISVVMLGVFAGAFVLLGEMRADVVLLACIFLHLGRLMIDYNTFYASPLADA